MDEEEFYEMGTYLATLQEEDIEDSGGCACSPTLVLVFIGLSLLTIIVSLLCR